MRTVDEAYVEAVLNAVEQIPPGRVASYGDLAELVGRGGPRLVGRVMSTQGAGVPWWRVVRADGRPARGLEETALAAPAGRGRGAAWGSGGHAPVTLAGFTILRPVPVTDPVSVSRATRRLSGS